jgi:hypothetical protein
MAQQEAPYNFPSGSQVYTKAEVDELRADLLAKIAAVDNARIEDNTPTAVSVVCKPSQSSTIDFAEHKTYVLTQDDTSNYSVDYALNVNVTLNPVEGSINTVIFINKKTGGKGTLSFINGQIYSTANKPVKSAIFDIRPDYGAQVFDFIRYAGITLVNQRVNADSNSAVEHWIATDAFVPTMKAFKASMGSYIPEKNAADKFNLSGDVIPIDRNSATPNLTPISTELLKKADFVYASVKPVLYRYNNTIPVGNQYNTLQLTTKTGYNKNSAISIHLQGQVLDSSSDAAVVRTVEFDGVLIPEHTESTHKWIFSVTNSNGYFDAVKIDGIPDGGTIVISLRLKQPVSKMWTPSIEMQIEEIHDTEYGITLPENEITSRNLYANASGLWLTGYTQEVYSTINIDAKIDKEAVGAEKTIVQKVTVDLNDADGLTITQKKGNINTYVQFDQTDVIPIATSSTPGIMSTALHDELKTATSDIADHQTQINDRVTTTVFDALATRVTTNEGNIDTLENDVDDLDTNKVDKLADHALMSDHQKDEVTKLENRDASYIGTATTPGFVKSDNSTDRSILVDADGNMIVNKAHIGTVDSVNGIGPDASHNVGIFKRILDQHQFDLMMANPALVEDGIIYIYDDDNGKDPYGGGTYAFGGNPNFYKSNFVGVFTSEAEMPQLTGSQFAKVADNGIWYMYFCVNDTISRTYWTEDFEIENDDTFGTIYIDDDGSGRLNGLLDSSSRYAFLSSNGRYNFPSKLISDNFKTEIDINGGMKILERDGQRAMLKHGDDEHPTQIVNEAFLVTKLLELKNEIVGGAVIAPPVPGNFDVQINGNKFDVTWTGPTSGFPGYVYKVYAKVVPSIHGITFVDADEVVESTTNSAEWSPQGGIVEGVLYAFNIRAHYNLYSQWATTIVKEKVAPNVAPTANAGTDQQIYTPASSVTLDATGSSDIDGTIVAYEWTKIAGPSGVTITNPTNATTTVTGLVEGTYTFHLTVTDDKGDTGTDEIDVIVAVPNVEPNAVAGADQQIYTPATSTSLDGSGSFDTDGSISAYAWTQTAGPNTATIASPAQATTNVSGLIVGTYTFKLTITDNKGATDEDEVDVVVAVPFTFTPAEFIAGIEGSSLMTAEDVIDVLDPVVPVAETINTYDYSITTNSLIIVGMKFDTDDEIILTGTPTAGQKLIAVTPAIASLTHEIVTTGDSRSMLLVEVTAGTTLTIDTTDVEFSVQSTKFLKNPLALQYLISTTSVPEGSTVTF